MKIKTQQKNWGKQWSEIFPTDNMAMTRTRTMRTTSDNDEEY